MLLATSCKEMTTSSHRQGVFQERRTWLEYADSPRSWFVQVFAQQPSSQVGDLPDVSTRTGANPSDSTLQVGKQSQLSQSGEGVVGVTGMGPLSAARPKCWRQICRVVRYLNDLTVVMISQSRSLSRLANSSERNGFTVDLQLRYPEGTTVAGRPAESPPHRARKLGNTGVAGRLDSSRPDNRPE